MKLAVFLPNWIGDTVMATPVLRALRAHVGPQGQLIGVLRPYVADVLAGTPWLDEQLLFDPRAKQSERHSLAIVKQLRAHRLDATLLLTNSFRTGLMAWLGGARRRVGYVRYCRGPLLTDKVYPLRSGGKRVPVPEIDSYRQLAEALGCQVDSTRLELGTRAEDEREADAVWNKLQLPPGDRVVVLNSGGAYGAAKLWPTEYFAELARRIVAHNGRSVLVVCGPSERQIAAQIVAGAGDPRVVSLADEAVSIGLTKACIRRGALLVTTDSGPRFFAVAFERPIVSLFGPTDPAWTRTHYDREICLQHEVPCGPCMERTCPLGHHQCMRDLTVDVVHRAVERQLELARSSAA